MPFFDPDKLVLIITMLVVLIGALTINYYFYKRQEELERRRLKSRQLQKQIEEILSTLSILKQLPCPAGVIATLSDYSMDLFRQLLRISPNPAAVDQLRQNSDSGPRETIALNNDYGVKRAQQGIRAARSIFNAMRKQQQLSLSLFNEYGHELLWLHGSIEADAHIERAQAKFEAKNKVAAIAHCKHARMAVNKIPGRDPRKNEKHLAIRQLIGRIEQPTAPTPSPKANEEQPDGDTQPAKSA